MIEQAKGIVAERNHVNIDTAFTLLRGYARNNNLPPQPDCAGHHQRAAEHRRADRADREHAELNLGPAVSRAASARIRPVRRPRSTARVTGRGAEPVANVVERGVERTAAPATERQRELHDVVVVEVADRRRRPA